jgi:hypothetical protein
VADELDARRQLTQQRLVKEASDFDAIEGAEDDEDAVEGAALALGEEFGAALSFWFDEVGERVERVP